MKKRIFIILLALLVIGQFIKPNRTVPDVDPNGTFQAKKLVNENVQNLLEGACYDCHSNDSTYPWYADIAPVSWWLQGHINGGRDQLNFSIWNSYSTQRQAIKIEEIIEVMEDQRMPLATYALMHKAGRIDKEEAQQIIDAFKLLQ